MSILLMIAILAGLMLLTSEVTCAVSKTHLEYSKVSMVDGSTYKMRLLDKYGDEIKSSNIAWKSEDKSIAKVSKNGKITAKKKGSVKISATYRGKTYKVKVKVNHLSRKAILKAFGIPNKSRFKVKKAWVNYWDGIGTFGVYIEIYDGKKPFASAFCDLKNGKPGKMIWFAEGASDIIAKLK